MEREVKYLEKFLIRSRDGFPGKREMKAQREENFTQDPRTEERTQVATGSNFTQDQGEETLLMKKAWSLGRRP